MREIPFTKTQSVGNDFILINADDCQGLDLPALAQDLCIRRFRVGSDGLLVVGPSKEPGIEISMKMFNPDGSEDFCGNGLRCAANHAVRMGWAKDSFTILQHGLTSRVSVEDGFVKAEMPAAEFHAGAIPVLADDPSNHLVDISLHGVKGTAISTGSTHFVVPVDELPDGQQFYETSSLIENDPLFPERTSVIWTKDAGGGHLQIRIWERGAGETLGCGTGAAAAAIVWRKLYGAGADIKVESKGGTLEFEVLDAAKPYLVSSRPEVVFTGTVRY
jgi:diaminopimelate epimerase